MKNIDEFKSRKEWERYLWEAFLKSVEKSKSEKQLTSFLNNLLSETEKKNIVRRLTVISLLKQRKTYKEIGEILWISPGTISAIKKSIGNTAILKNYYSKYSFYKNKKIAEKGKIRGLPPENIFDYLANIKWPTMTGRGRWRFLNQY
ncbi:MAG: hypothetical protein AUK06_02400 [Parcubacteria group bacterium CG2_30_36_18]|uniref:HTH luxR-type domain-containing protein n=1 Tax=Candidatus Nealsonbacteria bacterium CG_4_9_14_0_8_um_filter_36_17 TaxID=1974693 RepID=A0A2M8DM61_9BACT|nr:MAG: hypothetical protein AUK06_02400 [Parcubacteria group bacterium CG2_30_36_18]PJB99036.1 MAG: hypothetical protein CO078_00110 [Candidatus Nealsonbacteria bacterium CG_4_9_14_0_8_um_filter_36_17]